MPGNSTIDTNTVANMIKIVFFIVSSYNYGGNEDANVPLPKVSQKKDTPHCVGKYLFKPRRHAKEREEKDNQNSQ